MDENAVICNDHTIKSKDLNQSANHKSVFADNDSHPGDKLLCIATKLGLTVEDEAFAEYMDEQDPLRSLREEFFYPKMKDLVSSKFTIL